MLLKLGRRIRLFLNFFFIGGGILTFVSLFLMKNQTDVDILKVSFLNGLSFAILGMGNAILAEKIENRWPWTQNIPLRLVVSALVTVIYTTIAWVFIVWLWVLVSDGVVLGLSDMLRIIPKNRNSLLISLTITFFVSTFMHGRTFLINWRKTLVETEKLKKEHIEAQYETLKNQVNPHFLFNSLNVLTTLVHKDADLSEQFVRQLAHVYRYVLNSRDKEIVPLEEELQQLQAYIFLMKIRFGESLQVDFDTKSGENKYIAPLTLQMLVENALKHNEVSKLKPLHIAVYFEADFIVVRNNLQLRNRVAESTSVGLANIRARYSFLSTQKVLIEEENGFFTVKIPLV
jgi:sensor histidine kinase YesM